jgi:hypothetical protein
MDIPMFVLHYFSLDHRSLILFDLAGDTRARSADGVVVFLISSVLLSIRLNQHLAPQPPDPGRPCTRSAAILYQQQSIAKEG